MAAGFAFGEIFTFEREREERGRSTESEGGSSRCSSPSSAGSTCTAILPPVGFADDAWADAGLVPQLPEVSPVPPVSGDDARALRLPCSRFSKSGGGNGPGSSLVFGWFPMFYYVLHIYLIHLLRGGDCRGHGARREKSSSPRCSSAPPAPGGGFGLPVVYAFWVATVLGAVPGVPVVRGSPEKAPQNTLVQLPDLGGAGCRLLDAGNRPRCLLRRGAFSSPAVSLFIPLSR